MIAMREPSVRVKLKTPWLGHPINALLVLNKRMAYSLFQRDAAEIVKPEENSKLKRRALNKSN